MERARMVSVRRYTRDWRTYFAGAGLILIWFIVTIASGENQIKSYPQQSQTPAYTKKRKAPARRYENHEHATEDEHRTAEQFNWTRINAIAGMTVFFAGLAAFFAFQTYRATEIQAVTAQKSYTASLRPWVFISKRDAQSGLHFLSVGNPTIIVYVDLATIGQTPALRVGSFTKMLPYEDASTLPYQRSFCIENKDLYEKDSHQKNPVTGQTFFPGQPEQKLALFGLPDTAAFATALKNGKTFVSPVIVGCIIYTDVLGAVHSTGYIYDIKRINKDASTLDPFFITKGDIPGSEIEITVSDLGNGSAD